MRGLDFSSWTALLSTLLGLTLVTLMMVGIRLTLMQRMQQRRERENRQINERLRTLIAAYKVLGGSFTGELFVDPTHLRQLRAQGSGEEGSDRARRIRDAVEAALSDVILLGTEAQVRLAAQAASELAAGHQVHTAELVISLRDFIRTVLDLDPIPAELVIPLQGPGRPAGSRGADKEAPREGRQGKGLEGAMGLGAGLGLGVHLQGEDEPPHGP